MTMIVLLYYKTEIIDDLLSEIISNPLLQKENKRTFIANLKFLSHRILTVTDIVTNTEAVTLEKLKEVDQAKIEIELQKEQEKSKHKDKEESLSQIFSITSSILAVIAGIIAASSDIFLNDDFIKKLSEKNVFLLTVIIGVLVSTLGVIISFIIKKLKDKKDD